MDKKRIKTKEKFYQIHKYLQKKLEREDLEEIIGFLEYEKICFLQEMWEIHNPEEKKKNG